VTSDDQRFSNRKITKSLNRQLTIAAAGVSGVAGESNTTRIRNVYASVASARKRPKPVGASAGAQRWIAKGERSGLLMPIAATENASLCVLMKS